MRSFGGLVRQAVWARDFTMACSASRQMLACRLFDCAPLSVGSSRRRKPPPLPQQKSGRRLQGRDEVATELDHAYYAFVRRRRPNRTHRVELTPRLVRLCAISGLPNGAAEMAA